MKDYRNLSQDMQTVTGGVLSDKERFGINATEADVHGRKQRRVRSIEDFAGKASSSSSADPDLSEREDEDIFQHYMEEMRKAKLEKTEEKITDKNLSRHQTLLNEKLKDLEDLIPDLPRFEGFFKSQSQGKHPFEEPEFSEFKEKFGTAAADVAEEEKYDEELYKRELEGRLIGETLTPRQFEVLFKSKGEQGSDQGYYLKDKNMNAFLDARDIVRLMDEMRESKRRRMILDGECTEEQSHEKISKMVEESKNEEASPLDNTDTHREFFELYNFFRKIQSPEKLFEKEYYFDEGLGQSLKDHIEELKSHFPDLTILVRRDRDGYPIIKTQFKQKYKYNIEDLEKFNAEEFMTLTKESLDDVLSTILGNQAIETLDKQ